MIQLTPDVIPANLAVIHLKVTIEGLVSEKVFEAEASLKYKFSWDRRNAYNQKVYGIVSANGQCH
jgi:teneurin